MKKLVRLASLFVLFTTLAVPVSSALATEITVSEPSSEVLQISSLTKPSREIKPLANIDESYWKSQFSKYFNGASWITRNGQLSLSIKPKSFVVYGNRATAEKAWNALYTKFRKDVRWKNTNSMRGQFFCHYDKAKWKGEWNIEPWKTSFNAQCN